MKPLPNGDWQIDDSKPIPNIQYTDHTDAKEGGK